MIVVNGWLLVWMVAVGRKLVVPNVDVTSKKLEYFPVEEHTNGYIYYAMHVGFVVVGLLFWWG